MPFRSNESAEAGLTRAIQYLARSSMRDMSKTEMENAEEYLRNVVHEIGPVVDSYPNWHPFVRHFCSSLHDYLHNIPRNDQGFQGLDHTIFFSHGLITCPYVEDSVNKLFQSVDLMNKKFDLSLECSRIDVNLYNKQVFPVLIKSDKCYELETDLTIKKTSAVKMFCQLLVDTIGCSYSTFDWKDFSPCILGTPSGGRSSLFVNEETGQTLKSIFTLLVKQKVFSESYFFERSL